MKNLRCCREDGGFRFLWKVWQYWLAIPREEIDSGWIETQDLWCASVPSCLTAPGVDFPEACCCLSAPSQSASHTYIICISSSEGGGRWPGRILKSVKDEERIMAGVGRRWAAGTCDPCTGWEDNAWLWGCPGSQWGRMQSATALLDWSLWYCTALHCRAEAAPLWLTFDPGGRTQRNGWVKVLGKWLSGQTLATGGFN